MRPILRKNTNCWGLLLVICLCLMGAAASGQVVVSNGPAIPWLGNGSVAWGDYDGDGDSDLFTMGLDSNDTARTYLLKNTGTALVPDLVQNLPALWGGDADWGDLDGDGDLDLAVTGATGPMQGLTRVYQNNAGILSPLSTPSLADLSGGRVKWVDLDGDGDKDLLLTGVSSNYGLIGYIGRNDGGGTFTRVEDALYDTRSSTFVSAGDYDGDGLQDMAYGDLSPKLSEGIRTTILHNEGGMQFAAAPSFLPQIYDGSLDFGDADGDGDLDALIAGGGVELHLGVYPYNAGQFQTPDAALPGISNGEAKWADFDGDGHLDFVVAGFAAGGPECRVYQWAVGGYNLIQGPSNMPLLYHTRLDWADWNGDGHPDFAVQGVNILGKPESYVAVYNSVNGQFEF